MPRTLVVCLTLCACVSTTPRGPSWIQSEDPELAALASTVLTEQLKLNGVKTTSVDLDARLESLPGGALQIQIVCSRRVGHQLLARVLVKGHGTAPRRVIASMMAEAARDLAVDCR